MAIDAAPEHVQIVAAEPAERAPTLLPALSAGVRRVLDDLREAHDVHVQMYSAIENINRLLNLKAYDPNRNGIDSIKFMEGIANHARLYRKAIDLAVEYRMNADLDKTFFGEQARLRIAQACVAQALSLNAFTLFPELKDAKTNG